MMEIKLVTLLVNIHFVALFAVANLGCAGTETAVEKSSVISLDLGRTYEIVAAPSGKHFAVISREGGISIWDITTKKKSKTIRTRGPYSASFSPDGKILAFGDKTFDDITQTWKGVVKVVSVATGEELGALNDLQDFINSVSFSPDNKTLAILSSSRPPTFFAPEREFTQEITLWDATSKVHRTIGVGRFERLTFLAEGAAILSVDVSQDTVTPFGSSPAMCRLAFFDFPTGRFIKRIRSNSISALSLSEDKRLVATTGNDADTDIVIWDINKGKRLYTLPRENLGAVLLAFGIKGRVVACLNEKRVVELWNLRSRRRFALIEQKGRVSAIAFLPNSDILLTAMEDGSLHAWRINNVTDAGGDP